MSFTICFHRTFDNLLISARKGNCKCNMELIRASHVFEKKGRGDCLQIICKNLVIFVAHCPLY